MGDQYDINGAFLTVILTFLDHRPDTDPVFCPIFPEAINHVWTASNIAPDVFCPQFPAVPRGRHDAAGSLLFCLHGDLSAFQAIWALGVGADRKSVEPV